MMTLETLKSHVQAFIATEDAQFQGAWDRFMAFAEGKQAAADTLDASITAATTLLEGNGYTVTKA